MVAPACSRALRRATPMRAVRSSGDMAATRTSTAVDAGEGAHLAGHVALDLVRAAGRRRW